MTPKEKAKELVGKYKNDIFNGIGGMTNAAAKKCALVAVDEIINSNPTSELSDPFLGNRTYENVNYWEEVKQEIEKL